MKIMNILNLKKISQLILNNYNSPINFYNDRSEEIIKKWSLNVQ